MLVLTRKEGERIIIGHDIVITVVSLHGEGARVRLGIEAPPHDRILRGELEDRLGPQNCREERDF